MKRHAGFTLTELIVTMAIVGILVGIGVPSYRYVTTSNRMSSEINGLLSDLQYARSEAIREGTTIIVCPTTDGATCAAATTTWSTGWLVYSDLNGNLAVDPGEVLRVQKALSSNDTLSAVAATQFSFNREGFTVGVAANEVLTLHDSTNNARYARCLDVSPTGKTHVTSNAMDGTCT